MQKRLLNNYEYSKAFLWGTLSEITSMTKQMKPIAIIV
jgi:hypothetical protein